MEGRNSTLRNLPILTQRSEWWPGRTPASFPGPVHRNVASSDHNCHPIQLMGSHARSFQNFLNPTYLYSLYFSVTEQYRWARLRKYLWWTLLLFFSTQTCIYPRNFENEYNISLVIALSETVLHCHCFYFKHFMKMFRVNQPLQFYYSYREICKTLLCC